MSDDLVRSGLPRYGRTPRNLLRDPNVSDRAVRLYGVLDDYADVDTGKAWPKRATLAEVCGCSTDSIDRAVAELIAGGWLVKSEQRRDDGGNRANLYTLTAGPGPHGCGDPGRTGAAPPAAGVRPQEGESVEGEPGEETPRSARPSSILGTDADPDFVAWWTAYPRKVGKGQARKAWRAALKKASAERIIARLEIQAPYLAEEHRRGYCPHPATWLNGERWEDTLDDAAPTSAGGPRPFRTGDPECPIHANQHRDHCVGCAADAKAGDK